MRKVWFNYDKICLYLTTSQSGGEGQVNTQTKYGIYIQTDLIGQADIPSGI